MCDRSGDETRPKRLLRPGGRSSVQLGPVRRSQEAVEVGRRGAVLGRVVGVVGGVALARRSNAEEEEAA